MTDDVGRDDVEKAGVASLSDSEDEETMFTRRSLNDE